MKGSSAPIRNTKRGNKPWMLDLRYLDGKREFFETENLAVTRRREVLKNVRTHGTTALKLPYERLVAFAAAEKEFAALNLTLQDVVAFVKAHHSVSEPILFSKAITQFTLVKRSAKKDAEYVQKLKGTLTSLQRSTGDKLLSLVTRDEIETWLYRDQWKQDTIRSHRTNVRTFFKYALDRHWIAANPAAKLEPVERTNKPPGILKVDECDCLLRACKAHMPHFLPYVVLNLFCGIRPEEIINLIPENIDIKARHVEVPAFRGDEPIAKSRKRRLVDLSENAAAWLKDAEPIQKKNPKWYARQIAKLRTFAVPLLKCTFPWPKNCLRHSFGSYHLAYHGSAEKTALQMGHHSTAMLFEHYRALVPKAEAKKFWQIKPRP